MIHMTTFIPTLSPIKEAEPDLQKPLPKLPPSDCFNADDESYDMEDIIDLYKEGEKEVKRVSFREGQKADGGNVRMF